MTLKRLVISNFDQSLDHDGLIIIDPESLVGRYASLQHLELTCEVIEISEAEDPQALEPLEGQSCNLILRTKFPVAESDEEDSLLSLGFRSIPSSPGPKPYCMFTPTYELNMQYGSPQHASPPQSILPRLYDPFFHDYHDLSTSFAEDSEEFALLASKEYQAFSQATPWSPCYVEEIVDSDVDSD